MNARNCPQYNKITDHTHALQKLMAIGKNLLMMKTHSLNDIVSNYLWRRLYLRSSVGIKCVLSQLATAFRRNKNSKQLRLGVVSLNDIRNEEKKRSEHFLNYRTKVNK